MIELLVVFKKFVLWDGNVKFCFMGICCLILGYIGLMFLLIFIMKFSGC